MPRVKVPTEDNGPCDFLRSEPREDSTIAVDLLFLRRLSSRRPSLRPLQLLKSIQVLNGQFHCPATRERPSDVARQAPPKAMAAIVDFDERALAFRAVAAASRHAGIIAMGRRLRSRPSFFDGGRQSFLETSTTLKRRGR